MATLDTRICDTPGCNSVAKLQCPSCIKLGIQGSFFCSQVFYSFILYKPINNRFIIFFNSILLELY